MRKQTLHYGSMRPDTKITVVILEETTNDWAEDGNY